MARYFLRCSGCLEVMAVDSPAAPPMVKCGICGSVVECMGRVERDRLVEDHTACKCDERCTCARGPICSCKCGGENHGAGLAAVIHYTVDVGRVPLVLPASLSSRASALARFTEFWTLRAELQIVEASMVKGDVVDVARLVRVRKALRRSADSKIHSARMMLLRTALDRPVMASLF